MKSAGKVYKGGIVQIVSTPDSSSTIWKSCTTVGRRNYLLRLSQILHNDCHFLFQEAVVSKNIINYGNRKQDNMG